MDLADEDKRAFEFLIETQLRGDIGVTVEEPPPPPPPPVFPANPAMLEEINKIFGPAGWTSSVTNLQQDYVQEVDGKFSCGCSAIVKIVLRNGTYHEDVGYGIAHRQPNVDVAITTAKTLAVTDGLRRALRQFGHMALPESERQILQVSLNAPDQTQSNPFTDEEFDELLALADEMAS